MNKKIKPVLVLSSVKLAKKPLPCNSQLSRVLIAEP